MHRLTAGEAWVGLIIAVIGMAIIFLIAFINLKMVMRDALQEDKARLRESVERYIEREVRRRVRDALKHTNITIGVRLINESDIGWTAEEEEEERK